MFGAFFLGAVKSVTTLLVDAYQFTRTNEQTSVGYLKVTL